MSAAKQQNKRLVSGNPRELHARKVALVGQESLKRYSDLSGTSKVATTSFTYDAKQRLTNLHHFDGSNNNIANYTYTFDGHSRLTNINRNGTVTTYTYDDTDQVTGDGTATFTYDAEGNRTNEGYSTGTGNQLTSDGTWNYTYDDEGNQTKKIKISDGKTWTYGYDHRNQLIEVQRRTTDGGTLELDVDFKYDAYGNRLEKKVDSDGDGNVDSTQRYALDGWNSAKPSPIGNENWDVVFDLDGNNNLVTRYLRGDIVDQLFARIAANGDAFWYLGDHLGSIRDITDNTGVVKDSLSYDAFGNIISESDPNYGGRYKWTSREFDTEIELQYNRARYYDAGTGRWLSQDPLGFDAGDSNLYRYVNNRPSAGTDPSGLAWWTYPLAFGEGLLEGGKNIIVGTGKAGLETLFLGTDVLRMGGSAATVYVLNPAFGTPVYVPQYKGIFAKGAVEAGQKGELGNFTFEAVKNGASLGIVPIVKAAMNGDAQAAGDTAGCAILGVLGAKASQNPYSLVRLPSKSVSASERAFFKEIGKVCGEAPEASNPLLNSTSTTFSNQFNVYGQPCGSYSFNVGAQPIGGYSFQVGVHGSVPLPGPITFSAGQQVYPIFYVNAYQMPNIATNILNAQAAGHPTLLTYGGSGTSSVNRPLAMQYQVGGQTYRIPRPPSPDEYPFASTLESSPNSWIGHVPLAENTLQGRQLSNFYRYMNYRQFKFQVEVLGR